MLNRIALKTATKAKLKAAKILFSAGDNDTAGYLLGYVVECSLKAVICRKLKISEYPDTGKFQNVFATHEFDRLLLLSGYSAEIDLSKNPSLFNYWSILTKDWKPDIRYNGNIYTSAVIQDKLNALEDGRGGFLRWVKRRW